MMELKPAKRQKIKVPIMFTGASGSGKTLSALILAKGLVERMFPDMPEEQQWQKVALIDSEHERALLYANTTIGETNIGEFQHLDLKAPFTVERYRQAFAICKQAGCEVIVIDSLSHAWSGEGGILEVVSRMGGSMQSWNKVKPLEKEFLRLVTESDVHVIATTRSKQGYDFQKNDVGKTEVVKVGLKPDQKDTLEFEFAICFMVDQNHVATATKDNSNMFSQSAMITPEIGHKIYDWAEIGIDVKGEERKLRLQLISSINQLVASSEPAKIKYDELSFKMNRTPLESWSTDLLDRANKIIKGEI